MKEEDEAEGDKRRRWRRKKKMEMGKKEDGKFHMREEGGEEK
jgi:hypothetical protein